MKKTGKNIICKTCKHSFYAALWELKTGKKFCGYSCYWTSLIGKAPQINNTGRTAWNKGKKFAGGKGYGNWKGGITQELMRTRNSEEYKIWRKSIFKRDNYTCQMCGDSKTRPLQAHHIFPFHSFVKYRFLLCNGITLCKPCHSKLNHKKLFSFTKQHRNLINSYL